MSIRFIAALIAAVITGATVLVLGYFTEGKIRSILTSEVEARLILETRHLALLSSTQLLHEYPELTLQPLVTSMIERRPELVFVAVVDHMGIVHSHRDLRRLGSKFAPPPALSGYSPQRDENIGAIRANSELLVASSPATGPKGELIGTAYVGIEKRYIDDLIAQARRRTTAAIALCLIAGVGLTLIVMTRLLRPIGALKSGLERIGRGDFDTRVQLGRGTDLGLLAEAINDAAARLKKFKVEMTDRDVALSESHQQMRIQVLELQAEITRRKEAQEALKLSEAKLLHSQKMDAIGQLAGGVAHDFNNILTAIHGYASILVRRIDESDRNHTFAGEIEKACNRASALVRKLLAFSRKQVLAPSMIELNSIIEETEDMLRRLLTDEIELKFKGSPDLPKIKADPGEIEQIIMNLVVNARDALPDGGTILIETLRGELEAPSSDGSPQPAVVVRVSDNGIGMDAETQGRIFEPFFTTKDQGKGTGLGLSTIYGIVTQSGGDISVESKPGEGTIFTISFPLCNEEEQPKSFDITEFSDVGDRLVLVVDDEDSVRELIHTLLTGAGYRVRTATNGREAIEAVKNSKKPFDLVLSDVVMPELNGVEAYQQIREIAPEVRFIFMSGYAGGAYLSQEVLEESDGFVSKPFSTDGLLEQIRTVLRQDKAA